MKDSFWARSKIYLVFGLIALLIVAFGVTLWLRVESGTPSNIVTDYESCTAQPEARIQDSFPSVCVINDQRFENPKERAVFEAQNYKPKQMCGQALTDARHKATGALYTFPSTCVPEGWEKL